MDEGGRGQREEGGMREPQTLPHQQQAHLHPCPLIALPLPSSSPPSAILLEMAKRRKFPSSFHSPGALPREGDGSGRDESVAPRELDGPGGIEVSERAGSEFTDNPLSDLDPEAPSDHSESTVSLDFEERLRYYEKQSGKDHGAENDRIILLALSAYLLRPPLSPAAAAATAAPSPPILPSPIPRSASFLIRLVVFPLPVMVYVLSSASTSFLPLPPFYRLSASSLCCESSPRGGTKAPRITTHRAQGKAT